MQSIARGAYYIFGSKTISRTCGAAALPRADHRTDLSSHVGAVLWRMFANELLHSIADQIGLRLKLLYSFLVRREYDSRRPHDLLSRARISGHCDDEIAASDFRSDPPPPSCSGEPRNVDKLDKKEIIEY